MKRKIKKPVIQLTSLLDLLFVMIFVSLLQTKSTPTQAESKKPPAPRPAPVQKPVEKPVQKKVVAKKPAPAKPVVVAVNAVFHFYPSASSPNIPSGKYAMGGQFNSKTGELQLGGTSWISRPKGQAANIEIDMVPLSGVIDSSNRTFTGRIEFSNCREFNLYKVEEFSTTPISGKWEGTYTCLQGTTGLTLTIH